MEQPPFFEEYPALKTKIPWISIIPKPTPVQQMTQLQEFLGTTESIWVKLDNLTSEKYGGNKVRKLEFLLAEAIHQKKRKIATIGGLGTNHGLATTIHGATQNLGTRLYLKDQPITPHVLQNLKLLHYYGAELIYARNKWTTEFQFNFVDRYFRSNIYWLPMGGSTPIGVLGFVNAIFELKQQILDDALPEPKWIFVPVGSIGTIAGIELGLQLAGLQTRVKGVCVAPNQSAIPKKMHQLISSTRSLLRQSKELKHPQNAHGYELTSQFVGSGYGHASSEGTEAIQVALEHEHLTLDPTYTSKTFAAVLDYIRQGNQGPILYWHTLNSVNLSNTAAQVKYLDLPLPFHPLFE